MFHHFGRRFAYQFQGGPEEGWTPPWLQNEGEWHGPHHHGPFGHRGPFRGPRFFWWMQRGRGPFGPRGPFGHGGPFGHEGHGGPGRGRFFGRGDMKFALLSLLQERPMHGYEMMKALEEKSGGFYSPSAGSIYPTLQMLEDRGLVTAQEVEGKKVYSITDAGRALLAEQKKNEEEFSGPPWARGPFGGRRGSPEMQALRTEAMEVARLFAIAGKMSFRDHDPEQIARLRNILEQARKELSDMIYGARGKQEQGSAPHVDEA